jgi:Spy/CpxP family protein refolding chaperone
MKRLAIVLGVFGCAGLLAAQGPHRFGAEGRAGLKGGGDVPTTRIVEMMSKRLDLSAEQKEQVTAILGKSRAEIAESVDGMKSVAGKTREELKAVLTDEQKAKVEKLKENAKAGVGGFMRERGPAMREGMKAASEEMRLRMVLKSLDLSDEQQGKLKEVESELHEKAKAIQEEVKPKIEALHKEAKEKVNGILTDEQRGELEKRMKEGPPAEPGKWLERGRDGMRQRGFQPPGAAREGFRVPRPAARGFRQQEPGAEGFGPRLNPGKDGNRGWQRGQPSGPGKSEQRQGDPLLGLFL